MACCAAWQGGIRRHFDEVVYDIAVANSVTSDGREILYMEPNILSFIVCKVRAIQIMIEQTRLFLPVSALVAWLSP